MTVDIILLLILIVFILSGYRRGLILSLCSLLILVVSCLGASVAQEVLTPGLTERVTPQVGAVLAEKLEPMVEEAAGEALAESGVGMMDTRMEELAQLFGLNLTETMENVAENAMEPMVTAASQALAELLVESLAGTVVFLCAFIIIYLLLRSLELGVNTVDRLPVIHTLNHLGGGLVGCVSGAFAVVMFSVLAGETGLLPEEAFSGPVSSLLQGFVSKILG